MKSYAQALQDTASSNGASSSSSRRGRPSISSDWLSPEAVNIHVISNFKDEQTFQDYLKRVGIKPACRDIVSLLWKSSTKAKDHVSPPVSEQERCMHRVRNWILQRKSWQSGKSLLPALDLSSGGGLINHGNTCYLNVAIQTLRSIPVLKDAIMCWEDLTGVPSHAGSTFRLILLQELQKIMKNLEIPNSRAVSTLNIHHSLSVLMNIEVNRQQDAHECLLFLFNLIDEVLKESGVRTFEQALKGEFQSSLQCCECQSFRKRKEVMWGLELPLQPTNSGSTSLENILHHYTTPETLADLEQVWCDHCQRNTNTVKVTGRFMKPPEYLFVQLKRFEFDGTGRKISNRITFPAELDTNSWKANDVPDDLSMFKLHAAVIHEGTSMHAGHYKVYANHGEDQWFLFNDSNVTKSTLAEARACESNAYILVYKKSLIVNATRTLHSEYQQMSDTSNDSKVIAEMPERKPVDNLTCSNDFAEKLTPSNFTSANEDVTDGHASQHLHLIEKLRHEAESDSRTDEDSDFAVESGQESHSEEEHEGRGTKESQSEHEKHRLATAHYHKFEGFVQLSDSEWQDCFENGKLCRPKLSFYLRNQFKTLNQYCILNFKHSGVVKGVPGNQYAYAYCYCGHSGCKKFRFHITFQKQSPKISVKSSGEICHPENKPKTGELRGLEREIVMKKLKTQTAQEVQWQNVENVDPLIVRDGNLGDVKADDVLRKARSQAAAQEDLCKDDLYDVQEMQRQELSVEPSLRFIQEVRQPLGIYLYSQTQITTFLLREPDASKRYLYFDATGSIVRPMLHDKKRVFIYSGVTLLDGICLPVLQLISNRHDEAAIGAFLLGFRKFAESVTTIWPLFSRTVTDCSFASINQLSLQWNDMKLSDYLHICFKYVTGGFISRGFEKITVLRLCRNHFINSNRKHISNLTLKGLRKTFLMEGLASLLLSNSFQLFDERLTSFFRLLLSKYVYEGYSKDLTCLAEENVKPILEEADNQEPIDDRDLPLGPLLQSSPFYMHCMEKYSNIKRDISSTNDENDENDEQNDFNDKTLNKFYAPQFITDFFLVKAAALIPLWADILETPPQRSKKRKEQFVATNAPVEGDFNRLKNETLKKMRHIKAGRVVRAERHHILKRVCKKLLLGIKTSYKRRQSVISNVANLASSSFSSESLPRNKNNVEESICSKATIKGNNSQKRKKNSKLEESSRVIQMDFEDAYRNVDFVTSTPQDHRNLSNQQQNLTRGVDFGANETWKRKSKKKFSYLQKKHIKLEIIQQQAAINNSINDVDGDELYKLPSQREDEDVQFISRSFTNPLSHIAKTHYRHYVKGGSIKKPQYWNHLSTPSKKVLEMAFITHDYNRAVMVYGENDRPLFLQSFIELLTISPLSSFTLDACLHELKVLYERSDIFVSTITQGTQVLLTEFDRSFGINDINIYDYALLLLPFHLPEHWSLCVADIKLKKFIILDPAEMEDDVLDSLFQSFCRYLRKRKSFLPNDPKNGCIGWDIGVATKWALPKQNDNINCGVYVLRYTETILRCKTSLLHFDPIAYRVQLVEHLVERMERIRDDSAFKNNESLIFDRFDNGLLKSIKYYCTKLVPTPSNKKRQFVVSDFGNCFTSICSPDFEDLCNDKWLSTNVIDCAIDSIQTAKTREKFLNIRGEHAFTALSNILGEQSILFEIQLKGKILLMPYNESNTHWCLIIADIDKKLYRCLDPLKLGNGKQYQNQFLNFIKKRNAYSAEIIEVKGWTLAPMMKNLPQQPASDSTNCGVFVILYSFLMMGAYKKCKEFTIQKFRAHIAWHLLKETPIMKYLCSMCGKDEHTTHKNDNVSNMVQCDRCRRWLHHHCDINIQNLPFFELQGNLVPYSCEICLSFSELIETKQSLRQNK